MTSQKHIEINYFHIWYLCKGIIPSILDYKSQWKYFKVQSYEHFNNYFCCRFLIWLVRNILKCYCSLSIFNLDDNVFTWGRLDLAVPFTPSTPNRQNRNQVCWNICAGVRRSTPFSRWCRQNSHVTCSKTRWGITASMYGNICIAWFIPEYSKVPSFTCFRWLFWRTPSTLKLLNQVRPWCNIMQQCTITIHPCVKYT